MDPALSVDESERRSPPTPAAPSHDSSSDTRRKLHRSHTTRLNKPQLAHPLPYLDVLSLHSRRLVAQTHEQIAAHEVVSLKKYPRRQGWRNTDGHDTTTDGDEAAAAAQLKLEELLESVHLLLEPIQIPDLSHTGVFHESTSQLQHTGGTGTSSGNKVSLSSVDKEHDVKLFYPTGAKKANMREYIQETIRRHLPPSEELLMAQSCAELPFDQNVGVSSQANALGASTSAPSFMTSSSPSTSLRTGPKSVKKASKASTSPAKHRKSKFPLSSNSPQKANSTCGSPMLNPELTRQAKDIIAAIRANSSKINELMTS